MLGALIAALALFFMFGEVRKIRRLARKIGYTWEVWFLLSGQSVAIVLILLFILDSVGL